MVKVNDIGGIVEAATMKEKAGIDKIEDKIKTQSASQLAYSKLINLNGKMKAACNQLCNTNPYGESSSAFDEKLAMAVGMTPETMVSYFDIDATEKASLGLIKVKIDQIAAAEKWKSKSFSSRLSSATQAAVITGADPNMFMAGSFETKIQNNSKRLMQDFGYLSSVGTNNKGQFTAGIFKINSIDVDLSLGDSIEVIAAKINNVTTSTDVTAVLIDDKDNTKALVLNSNNNFTVSDPNGIFANLGNSGGNYLINQLESHFNFSQRFVQAFNFYPIAVTASNPDTLRPGIFYINDKLVLVKEEDSLAIVAQKITKAGAGVEAMVETLGTFPNFTAKLVMRSTSFGTEYDYFIDDPNNILVHLQHSGGDHLQRFDEYETITLDQGDNLSVISSKINACKDKTCLGSELAEISRGNIRLLLASTSTGVGNKFQILDNGTILNGTNSGTVFQNVFKNGLERNSTIPYNHTVINATDALLSIDDIELTRPTNKISDFLDGVIIILKQPTPNPMMVNIISNTEDIVKSVKKFVDQYNELLKFITKQQQRDENGKAVEGAVLINSDVLKKEVMEMRMQAARLVQANIGISSIDIPEEVIEDKKEHRKEPKYTGVLELSIPILVQALNEDASRVQSVFDYDFESTSTDFAPPVNRKNPIITLNNVSTIVDSYDISMDKSNAMVKSTSSLGFSDNQTSVVSTIPTVGQFTAGSFYINEQKITLVGGQSLNEIAKTINSASSYLRISTNVVQKGGQYFLEFSQYNGNDASYADKAKFEKMSIYDPKKVLNGLFNVERQTIALTSSLTDPAFTSGVFSLNGTDVTVTSTTMAGPSIKDLLSAINSKTGKTGVIAKADLDGNGNYIVYLTASKLTSISIDDTVNNVFNSKLANTTLGTGSYFWDTSLVFMAKARTSRGTYNKVMNYELSDKNDLNSGFISFNNLDDSKLKIYDFSLAYVGDTQVENASIIAKQGVAEWFANYIDTQNGSIYNGNSGEIQRDIKNLQKRKEGLENDKKTAETNLNRTQQSLRAQYAKLNAGVEAMKEQLQLLDVLNDLGGDNN